MSRTTTRLIVLALLATAGLTTACADATAPSEQDRPALKICEGQGADNLICR